MITGTVFILTVTMVWPPMVNHSVADSSPGFPERACRHRVAVYCYLRVESRARRGLMRDMIGMVRRLLRL